MFSFCSSKDLEATKRSWTLEWLQRQKVENRVPHLARKDSGVDTSSSDLDKISSMIEDNAVLKDLFVAPGRSGGA